MPDINFKDNWQETKQRYDAWLHGGKTDRPLLGLRATGRKKPPEAPLEEPPYDDLFDLYTNAYKRYARTMNLFHQTEFLAESLPQTGAGLGAGSMALYLGSDAVLTEETVWFTDWIKDYDGLDFKYDPDNKWWQIHYGQFRQLAGLFAGTDVLVGLPDICEGIDILSAMRGPMLCCFDLYDYPDQVKKALKQITGLYKVYYNAIYDVVKRPDGTSLYGPYNVYGNGKSAKLQCDYCALISPEHFDEFVLPYLREQCEDLDNTVYHLDGVECIVHLDSLLSLERLGAVQWRAPVGPPSIHSANEDWFEMYKKIKSAGKGLWLHMEEYGPEGAIPAGDKIIKAVGGSGIYFSFAPMDYKQADAILIHADKYWKS